MNRHIIHQISTCVLVGGLLPSNASASDEHEKDLSVTVFAGPNAKGFEHTKLSYKDGDQKLLAATVGWTPIDGPLNLKLGIEGGVAIRKDGDTYAEGGTSQELWFGPKIRHHGIKLGPVIVKPAITVGFSFVTESNGLERAREIRDSGEASFIYYAGPELALSPKSKSNLELVGRIHHRSGAERVSYMPTIGKTGDSNNANLLGLRYRF